MTWSELFERAERCEATVESISTALARRRKKRSGNKTTHEGSGISADPMARIVADADVLAADLLAGGPSREALETVSRHDWMQLVASEALLSDAEAVIGSVADGDLADAWRARIDRLGVLFDHPEGDHPALASARSGNARHVLSLDDRLQSAGAGTAIRREANVETSVRSPGAFVALFDPASVYTAIHGDAYPGPDRDSRF